MKELTRAQVRARLLVVSAALATLADQTDAVSPTPTVRQDAQVIVPEGHLRHVLRLVAESGRYRELSGDDISLLVDVARLVDVDAETLARWMSRGTEETRLLRGWDAVQT